MAKITDEKKERQKLIDEMKNKFLGEVRAAEYDNEANRIQNENINKLKELEEYGQTKTSSTTNASTKESDKKPTEKKDLSLKKDMTVVKSSLKSIESTIKTGNNAQLTVLKSISSKLEEAKKATKEKSSNKSSSAANVIEKLLTTTNARLTQLIGKIDLLNIKLSKRSTSKDDKSDEFIGPNLPTPIPVIKREVDPIEYQGMPQDSTRHNDKKGFISKTANGMVTGLLGRDGAKLVSGAVGLTGKLIGGTIGATGKLAASLVSRKDLERVQARTETKTWRKKVLELLSGKPEANKIAGDEKKDGISKVGLGIGALIAAALAYALSSDEVKTKIKNALSTIGGVIRNLGKLAGWFATGLDVVVKTLEKIAKWVGETAAKIVIAVGKAIEYAKGKIDKIKKFGKETWADTKEGAKTAWENTKKFGKETWADTKKLGEIIGNIPEKIAGSLARGAENLATAIYNAVTKGIDYVWKLIKAPFEPTDAEKERTEGIPNGRGAPQSEPDDRPRDKSGKVVEYDENRKPKIIPPVSPNLKQNPSPTLKKLDSVSNMADNIQQREKDKAGSAPTVINNVTNNSNGGNNSGDVMRLNPRVPPTLHQMMNGVGSAGIPQY